MSDDDDDADAGVDLGVGVDLQWADHFVGRDHDFESELHASCRDRGFGFCRVRVDGALGYGAYLDGGGGEPAGSR